jgi:glutamyl-tRNA synthetase
MRTKSARTTVAPNRARRPDAHRRGPKENLRAEIPPLRPLAASEIRRAVGTPRAPKKPRFRFAPSPTGLLHIGGARTALLNYLAAKKMGGEMVLRIEDTDAARSKPEYTEAIMRGLEWLGIRFDGEVVRQSERGDLYREKIESLVAEDKAYADDSGAVFFRMPDQGALVIHDRVKGAVPINVSNASGMTDFVIQRSDGTPTFLIANVVDDGEQGITHVIRGEDHLTNAARQICLFRALGYDVPEFYHLPLIVDDEGQKLSKRHGAASIDAYRAAGYDPDVMVNHLARLGMSYGTEATLSIDALSERIDLLRFSKSQSPISLAALDRRNLHKIARMPIAELQKEIVSRDPELAERIGKRGVEALADGARTCTSTFQEIVELGRFLIADPIRDPAARAIHGGPKMKALLADLRRTLEALSAERWSAKAIASALEAFNARRRIKYGAYGRSLRWMLTGLTDGLPLHHTLAILGRSASLSRIAEGTR